MPRTPLKATPQPKTRRSLSKAAVLTIALLLSSGVINVIAGHNTAQAQTNTGSKLGTPSNPGTSITPALTPAITPGVIDNNPTPSVVQGLPKLSIQRTPKPLIAGQGYTMLWSTDAGSVQWTCVSSGTGYADTGQLIGNGGTINGVANPQWINYPSVCTYTVSNDNGDTVVTENLQTVAGGTPPALSLSCSTGTTSTAPTPASQSCILSNTGQTTASSVTYNSLPGITLSGQPSTCAGSSNNCGTITLISNTAAGSYTGTLTATPSPAGTAATAAISMTVNAATAPALSLSNCSSITPTTSPAAASTSCTLSNTGQTAATGISYSAIANTSITGPTSCAANSTCGTVKVTTATSAGTYTGTLTATPSPAGTASSTGINLTVNPAAAALSAIISPSPLNLTLSQAGIASGQLTATPNGGTAPYTYTWSKTAGTRSTINNASISNPTISASLVANDNFTETWLVTVKDNLNVSTTASTNINFKVSAVTAPSLSFSNCLNTNNPVTAPANASITCSLSNTGQTTATGISYSSITGTQIVGASTCNANSSCGSVTITTTGTTAGTYSGTLTATPTPAGTVASTSISLVVNVASGTKVITYIHTDGLGSPVAKTNASGARITQTKYEAYGMTVAGSDTPTIGFTGHVNDADTGLTYMQQRYYDPVAARFLSEDPVLTDANTGASFNRYVYANNNPYRFIDPDGRFSKSACADMVGNCSTIGGDSERTPSEISTSAKVGAVVGGAAAGMAAAGCDWFSLGACAVTNPVMVAGGIAGGAALGAVTGQQIDKAWTQLTRLIEKSVTTGPLETQYALVANKTGPYPSVTGGLVYLKAGDVWKYGTTVDPAGRYPAGALQNLNLTMDPQSIGTRYQVLAAEKLMLIQYSILHGELPPGNRIYK